MDPLAPIPSPISHRFRYWRHRVVHGTAFILVCCAIGFAWAKLTRPSTFFGQVEVIQAGVASPDAGLLTNLWVVPFQEVRAGDLVAEVTTTDPRKGPCVTR